jgi:hypothetical protein
LTGPARRGKVVVAPRLVDFERLAASTKQLLGDLKSDIREFRHDQRRHFRMTFGALITLAIALAGLMAHGFMWL